MGEIKHKEWSYEVHELSEGFVAIVYDENGFCVADMLTEDRARLIAAAPELLEALIEARDALHQHYVDWDGEPEDAVALQLARSKCNATIARATGAA